MWDKIVAVWNAILVFLHIRAVVAVPVVTEPALSGVEPAEPSSDILVNLDLDDDATIFTAM